MRRFLILFLLLVQCVCLSAQKSVTIDGVVYTAVYDDIIENGCYVTSVESTSPAAITIKAEVVIDGISSPVKRITNDALHANIRSITIEAMEVGSRVFQIQEDALKKCPDLERLVLPKDISTVNVGLFVESNKLSVIVLDSEEPIRTAANDKVSDKIAYYSLITGIQLFVPDDAVDVYKNYTDGTGSWPDKGFWNAFDVRPMSELEDEPDPEPQPLPEGVRMPMANGGSVVLLDAVPGHRMHLPSTDGCSFKSATFNGEDASQYISDEIFTVPEYVGVADFIPVFEVLSSADSYPMNDDINIKVVGNTVEVDYAGVPVHVEIFNTAGQCTYDGIGTNVSLAKGVYILKTSGRTFKFAI